MDRLQLIEGRAYPLGGDNIDTDIILPGRFLKVITRANLGAASFESIRAVPGNVFSQPAFANAPILLAGDNFGCGSSREHAVWAMMDLGIRAVIAVSFSDIFSGNAFKNGLLTIALAREEIADLLNLALTSPFIISLEDQTIRAGPDYLLQFEIDAFRKQCLLDGLDEIALTLSRHAMIDEHEARRSATQWLEITA